MPLLKVSEAAIRRVPRYYRCLIQLQKDKVEKVSSVVLSEKLGYSASQIRKDFNYFGGFGQTGYGYNVNELKKGLEKIIGIGKTYNLVLVGAGNIGNALVNYPYFEENGFYIRAIFDNNPRIIGTKINHIEVKPYSEFEEFLQNNKIDIGIITVPPDAAVKVADELQAGDVKAIWNFAPVTLNVKDVYVENMFISDSLYNIAFHLAWPEL